MKTHIKFAKTNVMELYPQDLGEKLGGETQRQRVRSCQQSPDAVNPNFLGGWILGGLAVTGLLFALQAIAVAVVAGIATTGLIGCYIYSTLRSLDAAQSRRSPLTTYEVQTLRQGQTDPLSQQFLTLADSVIALPVLTDAVAEREVREAISALSLAIQALPLEQKVVTDNPAALRAEAAAQECGASAEADTIIAASLRRRADSLARRAETAARTLLLLRRNQALREEVGEQIRALHTSLTALKVGGRQSAPELSGLAASIQRVAHEANAITEARAEVDTLIVEPHRTKVSNGNEAAKRIVGG